VADLLRSELSQLLLRRVQDPRVKLVSLSRVDVSPDLRQARVLVSVLGSDDERRQALEGLSRARGFLRSELARSLRHLRAVPELTFALDRGAEHSQRISQLLEDLDDIPDESA
jgi:ribosome-binding factor A